MIEKGKKMIQTRLDVSHPQNNIVYTGMKQKEVTFKGGLEHPIHRWFVLTPSFSPDLVNSMLYEMETNKEHSVLDPFAGIGTTLIECKRRGIKSVGIEINPILYKITSVELNWNINVSKLKNYYGEYMKHVIEDKNRLGSRSLTMILNHYNTKRPKLHNIFRWWKEDVLKDLFICRENIKSLDIENEYKEIFEVGLACILVDVANVTRGRLQLAFIDKSNEDIDVLKHLKDKMGCIVEDFEYITRLDRDISSRILNGDSTKIHEILDGYKIDRVITSPPYPNRYSYVWNTRPHLFFLEIFKKPSQSADLDMNSIGGTWGRATSDLNKGIVKPYNSIVADELNDVTEEIRGKNNLMANYIMKYFNLITVHIEKLKEILSENAKCAYVVGNSRINGIEVKTDEILGGIFSGYGFNLDKIMRVRKRHSGIGLHEAIVYSNLE